MRFGTAIAVVLHFEKQGTRTQRRYLYALACGRLERGFACLLHASSVLMHIGPHLTPPFDYSEQGFAGSLGKPAHTTVQPFQIRATYNFKPSEHGPLIRVFSFDLVMDTERHRRCSQGLSHPEEYILRM